MVVAWFCGAHRRFVVRSKLGSSAPGWSPQDTTSRMNQIIAMIIISSSITSNKTNTHDNNNNHKNDNTIAQETTNRMNRLSQAESENEVNDYY